MSAPGLGYPGYYNQLGVHPDADLAEIEAAYRRQSAAAEVAGDGEALQGLAAAYAVIGNPELRSTYDRQRGPMPRDELVEAGRPVVAALVVGAAAATVLALLGERDPGSLLIGAWALTGAWVTWRPLWGWLRRVFGWLGWSWMAAVALPCLAVGWVVGPLLLVAPAVKLARLGWPLLRRHAPDLRARVTRRRRSRSHREVAR